MAIDWTSLRSPAPGTLVAAREVAHYAVQPVTCAARANLPAAADDSHSALTWNEKLQALVSAPLPGSVRAGLRVATLEYVLGDERGASPAWLDAALAKRGLKPASGVKLPYEVPARPLAKDAKLETLARWFAAAADALGEARAKHARLKPGAALLWPHHFDLATLAELGSGKSIGIGISPGDHYYAQPYAYISAYPGPQNPAPPPLPAGGRWHTKDFFAAVATADDLLAQRDPRAALLAVIDAAVAAHEEMLNG